MTTASMRHGRVQCKACPWKRSTVPARDIPTYDEQKHRALDCTIAQPADAQALLDMLDARGADVRALGMRAMACHESPVGGETLCVGWVMHQLGPGNNLLLRFIARDGQFRGWRTVGDQCASLEETITRERGTE
jgi:hypothetical protein